MTKNLFHLAVLAVLAAAQSEAQTSISEVPTGVIEGQVLRQANSEPIPNARVILWRAHPGLPRNPEAQGTVENAAISVQNKLDLLSAPTPALEQSSQANRQAREQSMGLPGGTLTPAYQVSAKSDRAGSFRFTGLESGRYTVQVDLEGFFGLRSNMWSSTIVTLEPGKAMPPVKALMIKGGNISGLIMDPFGKPAPNVAVGLSSLGWSRTGSILRGVPLATRSTDDRGEFRLHGIPPGQCFIEAPTGPGGSGETRTSWARTFYPGEMDPLKAVQVTITDGTEVGGISFGVRTVPTSSYSISGTAINPLANAPVNRLTGKPDRSIGEFLLVPAEPDLLDRSYLSGSEQSKPNQVPRDSRPNGEFEIRNVKPGVYDLYATYSDFSARRFFIDGTRIEVRSADVKGISLSLRAGATLQMEIVVDEAATQPLKVDSLSIGMLSPVDPTAPNLMASVLARGLPFDANGRLAIDQFPEGRYSIGDIQGLPSTGYIADVRQGEASVFDTGFLLGPDTQPVRIVVNPQGGTIAGVVENADRQPVAGSRVVLVPPPSLRWNVALYKDATTDDAGRFGFRGIRPGAYTLFSWENAPPPRPELSAEFISKHEKRGRVVNVTAGTTAETTVILIPDETQQ